VNLCDLENVLMKYEINENTDDKRGEFSCMVS